MSVNVATYLSNINDLRLSSYRVLSCLVSFMNEKGFCWPHIATMVERSKIPASSFYRGLKELKSKGYITVINRYAYCSDHSDKKGQTSNLYIIHGILGEDKERDINDILNDPEFDPDELIKISGGKIRRVRNRNLVDESQPIISKNINQSETPPLSPVESHIKNYTKEDNSKKYNKKGKERLAVIGESASPNRKPRGNPKCKMTKDYEIPPVWIVWAVLNHKLNEKYVLELVKDFKSNYSCLETFESCGWESLWRSYVEKRVEERERTARVTQEHVCSCGEHRATGILVEDKATNLAWFKYVMNKKLSRFEEDWLNSYEETHGNIYQEDDPKLYKNKMKRLDQKVEIQKQKTTEERRRAIALRKLKSGVN